MLVVVLALVSAFSVAAVQNVEPGRQPFETRCARCHGADGNGGDMGPPIALRLATRDDQQLAGLIRDGLPGRGMPPSRVADPEMADLLKFLRTIQRRATTEPVARKTLQLQTTSGKTLEGQVLAEGFDDMQLRTEDKQVHLLRRAGSRFREVTSATDWPTYNGDPGGNRYTTLTQINKGNVARLTMAWMFTLPGVGSLQVTPVVAGGIMYVAAPNECYALDAGSGRQIWHYKRPRTPNLSVGGGSNTGSGRAGTGAAAVVSTATVVVIPSPCSVAARSGAGTHPAARRVPTSMA